MLEVRSLEKSFGSKQVLFGIDFQHDQVVFGTSRENGAGKEQQFSTVVLKFFMNIKEKFSLDGQDIRQETYARIGLSA